MQYSTCGSHCPLTCENRDDDVNCAAVCVSGCFCPSGKALIDNDTCIDPELCPNSTESKYIKYMHCIMHYFIFIAIQLLIALVVWFTGSVGHHAM